MEEKPVYNTGSASIFHGHAVKAPAPLYCDVCGQKTAAFVRDEGKYERYECTCCHMIQMVAVR